MKLVRQSFYRILSSSVKTEITEGHPKIQYLPVTDPRHSNNPKVCGMRWSLDAGLDFFSCFFRVAAYVIPTSKVIIDGGLENSRALVTSPSALYICCFR
jgi:hypothetical protein